MNDFDYQGIPYFKIEQDASYDDFLVEWIEFCITYNYDMFIYKPKLGWLSEDFENFKITVIAELR